MIRQLRFKRHRFPPELLRSSIWLYSRLTPSFRGIEEILGTPDLDVSDETIRRCVPDEMVTIVQRKRHWLWRAVDKEGEVLDFLVKRRRDAKAALKLMKKLLKKQGFAPSRIVTDKLRSYPSAFRAMGPVAEHDRSLRANNRAKNSHQPVRRREHKQQRFKSPGSAQRFHSIHSATYNTFGHQRHLLKRPMHQELRSASIEDWQSVSAAA